MIDKIKKVVELYPDKIAYKVNNQIITYRKLWKYSNEYANSLIRQGTSPVIIYGNKDISVIISILSCILANRSYVVVGTYIPMYRLEQIIDLTKSTLILSDISISCDNIECLSLDELKKYENQDIKENNNDIIYIIFTSGSTGVPKGVPISKENLNNFIDWISNLKPLCDYHDINVLNQANFGFDLSVCDLFYSLCNGHTLIAFDNDFQNYNKIFDILKEIDVAVMTPTFIKLCFLNQNFNENNYAKLKCIYFCGEQLEVKTVKKLFESFPNLKVINAYGPTEATSAVSGILITKDMVNSLKILPVGEINTSATKILIVDDEIVLKGKSVFNGYLGDNIGGYYKEGYINCFKTGDIGYIEDGKLYCKGRKNNQIKYKGYRIELSEIEYYLNLIDGVRECAVIAKYDDNLVVKTIKAFVVVDNNIDDMYIKKELEKYLPIYMIPKSIKIIDKLPINHNGKIDRKVLNDL